MSYEETVRESFKRSRLEELIARKAEGGLTPEASVWLDEELSRREISSREAAELADEIEQNERLAMGLPRGLTSRSLAKPSIRLAAHLVDHSIALSVLIAGHIFSLITDRGAFLFVGIVGYVAYYLLRDALPNGMSPGKRLFSIRVVDLRSLDSCSLSQSLMRNVISILPLVGLLDGLSIFGRLNQRWGDRLARTLVINVYRSILYEPAPPG